MGTEEKAKEKRIFCPYCDEKIMKADLPYCQACGLKILYCPECGKPVNRGDKVCPHCGAEVKGEQT